MTTVVRPLPPGGPATGRPPVGPPGAVVPPGVVPLGFLAASGVALVLFGAALARAAADLRVSPSMPRVLTAVHTGLLGVLTIGVLGAMHQFAPVVAGRPLRSVRAVVPTAALVGPGVGLLAAGFSSSPPWLVPVGGAATLAGILVAAWNLSGPLLVRGRGVPLVGLRCALGYLLLTASFGVVYAVARSTGWFPLLERRVLAHAHLGLLGWLGLAYVSVAEKLWPMFLLAHRPHARSGAVAVGGLALGTLPLALGLLAGWRPLAWAGGALVVVGAGGHLTSLVAVVRHRRRPLELLHGFVVAGALSLVLAAGAGVAAGLAPVSYEARVRLVCVEVSALFCWLALALVGHAHKVVPFIAWTELRKAQRIGQPGTAPVLFADLYRRWAARATFALVLTGSLALLVAAAGAGEVPSAAAAAAFAAGGTVVSWNLLTGPRRALRRRLRAGAGPAAVGGEPATPGVTLRRFAGG